MSDTTFLANARVLHPISSCPVGDRLRAIAAQMNDAMKTELLLIAALVSKQERALDEIAASAQEDVEAAEAELRARFASRPWRSAPALRVLDGGRA